MIQQHFLPEDHGEVSDNLDTLHKTSMDILKSATHGEFETAEISMLQLQAALKKLKQLNGDKLKRNEWEDRNHELYEQVGWAGNRRKKQHRPGV